MSFNSDHFCNISVLSGKVASLFLYRSSKISIASATKHIGATSEQWPELCQGGNKSSVASSSEQWLRQRSSSQRSSG